MEDSAYATAVVLHDVAFFARHGVMPQERTVGARFRVNLAVFTDFSRAMLADELAHTISYAEVYDTVKAQMDIPSRLLEHVAWRICRAIFQRFTSAQAVRLELLKESPPMGADCPWAGVRLDLTRQHFQSLLQQTRQTS